MAKKIHGNRIIAFDRKVLTWYQSHRRKFSWRENDISLYHVAITELLLQRTRAETVEKYLPTFFTSFPGWEALSNARTSSIEKVLLPVGLWRRRAISFKSLAKEMVKLGGRFPRDRDEIEALPAIGQYVASAILLYMDDEPVPLLDASMARLLERYFGPRKLADIRYDPYLQKLARDVVGRSGSHKEINWATLDFAALVCTQNNPRCDICILEKGCKYS